MSKLKGQTVIDSEWSQWIIKLSNNESEEYFFLEEALANFPNDVNAKMFERREHAMWEIDPEKRVYI